MGVRLSDAQLREVAERLAAEFSDVPESSVLRCLARAVHHARLDGLPDDQIPAAGEKIARQLLILRHRPMVVPHPRRPID
ncbi:MAG: hypothetical protein ABWX84_12340 [Nocardioides sp.]